MFRSEVRSAAKRLRGATTLAERPVRGAARPRFFAWALLSLFQAYRRYLSPLLPRRCRFHPTCSRYAMDAIGLHGLGRGSALSLRRLLSCHPFHPGGVDPVPPLDGERSGRNEPARSCARPTCL